MRERYLVLIYLNGVLWHVSLCRTRKGAELSAKSTWECGCGDDRKAVIIPASELLNWHSSALHELEDLYRLESA